MPVLCEVFPFGAFTVSVTDAPLIGAEVELVTVTVILAIPFEYTGLSVVTETDNVGNCGVADASFDDEDSPTELIAVTL